MRPARALFLVALVFGPRAGWAQGNPLGPEFRVNTYTTSSQDFPSVASDSSGNFVVVWESLGQDGSSFGVFGQGFASSGAPLGPEFRVNTYTTNVQRYPAVSSDSSGNFVVVWQGSVVAGFDIFGQRFDSSGVPLGPEFRVNTYTLNIQRHPAVARDSSGDFVVVWESGSQDGESYGIFGQRFLGSGAPAGPEFRVNTVTTSTQSSPSVASDAAGNFVVVWQSHYQDGSDYGIYGQRYASSGVPLGAEFRVNTFTINGQNTPSVASDSSGNFVVAWTSNTQEPSSGIFGQRYSSSGAPLGPEFHVNTYTSGSQAYPSVASDASGNFAVVWLSFQQDGSDRGVYGQRFSSTGAPLGGEFRVNTFTTGAQGEPAVTSDTAGNFVVAWSSYGQDGAEEGVFGQRYSEIVPVELMQFTVE